MKIIKMNVSPTLAKEWLTKNTGNRKLSDSVVMNYAVDMQDGKWIQDTGETIKFAGSFDRLIDGQHRLHALVLADANISLDIAIECNEDAFKVIDTGKKRAGKDIISIEGYKSHAIISSGVRQYIVLQRGKIKAGGGSKTKTVTQAAKENRNPTNQEILETAKMLDSAYSIEEVAKISKALYEISVRTTSVMNTFAFVYLFAQKHGFNKVLTTLECVSKNDVLLQYWKDCKLKAMRFTDYQIINFHYFAFKTWISGKQYKQVNSRLYFDIDIADYIF